MHIGILTFHFPLNYGAMLQAHALLSRIQIDGHSCQIIDYMPEHMSDTCNINPLFTKMSLLNKTKSLIKLPLRYLSFRQFAHFSREYLSIDMTSAHGSKKLKLPDHVEAVIVGSDQVWNGNITNNDRNYFFALQDDTATRHSYAASMGSSVPTEVVSQYCREYLPRFTSISVRESSVLTLLETEIGLKASHVLDPVFLHDGPYWSRLAKKPARVAQKYLLFYSLEDDRELAETCRSVAKASGLPIISIHPFGRCFIKESTQIHAAGPLEFLWLIEHAAYIGTNSFHAVAFSSIFKKKLIYKSHSSLGSRVSSLLALFSIVHEMVSIGKDRKTVPVIDFFRSDHTMVDEKILFSKSFLQGIYR